MGDLKGLTDLAEHLIYEALGLLVPGAAASILVVCALMPDAWAGALAFVGGHPWIGATVAYVAGFIVQSLSRPVCNVTGALLGLPYRLLLAGVGLCAAAWRAGLERRVSAAIRWLRSGHAPAWRDPRDGATAATVALNTLEHAHWHARLGAPSDARLAPRDVLDLSFSALGDDRRRLARFRALTSLCRAVASLVALAGWGLAAVVVGPWPATAPAFGLLAAAVFAFYALLERADMYNAMWGAIITPQFLAGLAPVAPATSAVAPAAAPSASPAISAGQDGQDAGARTPTPVTAEIDT